MFQESISPVVDVHRAMRGEPMSGSVGGGIPGAAEHFNLEIDSGGVDLRVPRYVGAIVLGAGATLFVLRMAGFRFSFGAKLGGAA